MVQSFSWIGESIPGSNKDRREDAKFYGACQWNKWRFNLGDYVLVMDDDSLEPDLPENCFVAQIEQLYEKHNGRKDPYRARVQWLSKPDQLPQRLKNWPGIFPPFNHEFDVIHEGKRRPKFCDISIETILQPCFVLEAEANQDPAELLANYSNALPVFVLRYKMEQDPARLEPYLKTAVNTPSTPSSSRKIPRSAAVIAALNRELTRSPEIPRLESPIQFKSIPQPKKSVPDARVSVRKQRASPQPRKRVGRKLKDVELVDMLDSDEESSDSGSKHDDTETPEKGRIRKQTFSSPLTTPSPGRSKRSSLATLSGLEPVPEEKEITPGAKRKLTSEFDDLEESMDGKKNKSKRRFVISGERDYVPETPAKQEREKKSRVTPTQTPKLSTPKRGTRGTPQRQKLPATPKTPKNQVAAQVATTPLSEARKRLHVSAVPTSLPCREEEFTDILAFVESKFYDETGGCMYISGVPGTGKTATVQEVIRSLKQKVDEEEFPEFKVNGMRCTDPHQAYVHILQQLTGQKAPANQASQILDTRFSKSAPRREATLLVVDELDLLWTRKQNVLYNIFDWPSRQQARLVVLAIANTMDLPERILMNRVASRLGLTRLIFQPYTFRQLQEIVTSRLKDIPAFDAHAIQLAARKVAAVSGDARRALDICRRAAEIADLQSEIAVTTSHVDQAIAEMFSSPKINAIMNCSLVQQVFLKAVVAEFERTGVEEAVMRQVIQQYNSLSLVEGLQPVAVNELLSVCAKLGSCRILITEHGRKDIYQRIRLNVSVDDVHFALRGAHNRSTS